MQQLEYNDFNIDVEGHTDNTPIASLAYPSNWELSTARAANIVKYFNDMGIDARRLKASGYADSRPVIEYDSLGFPFAASKETNRRVVLRLYYSTETLLEERIDDEPISEQIAQENIADVPDISILPEPSEDDVLVIADQPAMVTLVEQNRIEEARSGALRDQQAEEVQEPISENVIDQTVENNPHLFNNLFPKLDNPNPNQNQKFQFQ